MLLSIFTRPLFINPQAYLIIPELASIHNYTPYDFDSTEYSFKVITSGRIAGELLKAKDDYILHLDLYSNDGNCILGEFYLKNRLIDLNSFNLLLNGNIVTINFSSVPSPIASYRTYDKTNDDADRDVLTDLTGNGHDIQLYNFAFAENSGYGKYANDFSKFSAHPNNIGQVLYTKNKIQVTGHIVNSFLTFNYSSNIELNSMKVKISNFPKKKILWYYYMDSSYNRQEISITTDGIYNLPNSYLCKDNPVSVGFIISAYGENYTGLTIEQIPDYQGALVSDGVDDYGLCENFPLLDKEKGFTICAIRTFSEKGSLCSNGGNINSTFAFVFEGFNFLSNIYSFGKANNVNLTEKLFTYMTSINYNGQVINKGNAEAKKSFILFRFSVIDNRFYKGALYALEIYDRDLTDEEIATVKARMIAEYEEKTGNKYEEETT